MSNSEPRSAPTAVDWATSRVAELLDEPLSALDAKLRKQLRVRIKTIRGALGTTTVYVTHDRAEALALSDRVIRTGVDYLRQTPTPGSPLTGTLRQRSV